MIFVFLSPIPASLLALTGVAGFALGCWAAGIAEREFGREDDGRIVIDEIVGQWLALAPLRLAAVPLEIPWLVTGFVLFRVFDVWKPGPVRWAERRFSGGVGVMLDDVLAGLLAAGVLAAARLLVPWLAAEIA